METGNEPFAMVETVILHGPENAVMTLAPAEAMAMCNMLFSFFSGMTGRGPTIPLNPDNSIVRNALEKTENDNPEWHNVACRLIAERVAKFTVEIVVCYGDTEISRKTESLFKRTRLQEDSGWFEVKYEFTELFFSKYFAAVFDDLRKKLVAAQEEELKQHVE